jgi:20S proteasome subunit beta 2
LKLKSCCGAGTAADTEYTTKNISSQLELHRLNSGRQVRVVAANRLLRQYLFRYQGYVSAALVLGGVDVNGPYLGTIAPHGSSDRLPYVTMGSGSLAAMSVFEDRYKPNLSEEEGKELVADAIRAGIFNDLGSGSNVDLCVITNMIIIIRYEGLSRRKFRSIYAPQRRAGNVDIGLFCQI